MLESANVKLASVATDVLGKSGRSMPDALLGGQDDPEMLAEFTSIVSATSLDQADVGGPPDTM